MQLQKHGVNASQFTRSLYTRPLACRPCRPTNQRTTALASRSLDNSARPPKPPQHVAVHRLHLQEQRPRAATAPTAITEAQVQQESVGGFKWLSHWYPVHVLDELDPVRPHAVELLGKQLVLWRDSEGVWRCFEDACPHRLAPLSEGRIAADGTLMCSYHGWRFSGTGGCVDIPQALDAKSKAVACSSRRACAVQYPTQQAYGLVWVWPTAGADAEAVKASWDSGKGIKWFRRELEYSHDILTENLVDPAHVPWAHHNLNPGTTRSKGGAMTFQPIKFDQTLETADAAETSTTNNTEGSAQNRPIIWHTETDPLCAFEYGTAIAPDGAQMAYTPPCSITCQYKLSNGKVCCSELLGVPKSPGRSVAITMLEMTDMPKLGLADVLKALFTKPGQVPGLVQRLLLQGRPLYEEHLQANKLFDQDMVFLSKGDRLLTQRGKSSWARSYYMPTPSDSAVIAARRWFDKSLQLPLDPLNATSEAAATVILLTPAQAAAPAPSRHQQMDRYSQHTKHCIICQQAMQKLQKQLQIVRGASLALGAAALGMIVAGCVLLSQFVQSATGGKATIDSLLGTGGWTGVLVSVISEHKVMILTGMLALVLGVRSATCAAWASATQKKLQKFEYVEFYHADNN